MNHSRPKSFPLLFYFIPALALFFMGLFFFWVEARVKRVLLAEIEESLSYRATTAKDLMVARFQGVDRGLSLYAGELDLSRTLEQAVDEPLPVGEDSRWFVWFLTTAQDQLLNLGSPAAGQELKSLVAATENQDTVSKIIETKSAGIFYARTVPIIDETGSRVGRVFGGMGLDQGGPLVEALRSRSGASFFALLHDGNVVGMDTDFGPAAAQLKEEMNGRTFCAIRKTRAYALHKELEIKDLDLSVLLVVNNDKLPSIVWNIRAAALGVVALALLTYLIGITWLKRRHGSALQHLLNYTEKAAGADTMVPDYHGLGLTAFDDLGRGIGRLAGEIQTRRRELVEQLNRERVGTEVLREREVVLSSLLEALPNGILSTDEQGKITHMNQAAQDITGWPRQEARGLPAVKVVTLIHPLNRELVATPIEAALQLRETTSIEARTLLVSRDGKEYQVAGSGAPFPIDKETVGAVLVLRDTTEQYFRHNQENQTRKMEAIGQLAGGIAHDFNNLLSAIMGYAELLEQDLHEEGCNQDLIDSIEQIINVSKQGARLTSQLLAFSRQGKMKTEILDIHVIIRSVLKIAKRTFSENILIEKNLTAEPSLIRGDPAQLENAVLNLALNAREAMGDRGKLTVSTSLVALDESFCRRQKDPVEPGEYLELSFSDTGAGMSRGIIEKIFEPFYTTKPLGSASGSGLGLAAVYGTVTAHHGAITVYSEPEFGTVFKLHLPLVGADEPSIPIKKKDKLVKGEGLILLIEDEQVVREIAMTMLAQFGYQVIEAHNGQEGVDQYRRFQDKIGLIILDMEMPVMSGKRAMVHLKEINPEVRILIASGYSLDMESKDFFEQGGVRGFIQKPYLMADFSKIIAKIMAGEQPSFE